MDTGEFERIIEKERKKRWISQELLSLGICHSQQISKIENSEKVPGFFLAELGFWPMKKGIIPWRRKGFVMP